MDTCKGHRQWDNPNHRARLTKLLSSDGFLLTFLKLDKTPSIDLHHRLTLADDSHRLYIAEVAMINLQGIRLIQKGLNQKEYTIYLTTATIEEIHKWFKSGHISADIWKRGKLEGYQRKPDDKRAKTIAEYLEGKLKIEETILPSSIILNIREKGCTEFNAFKESKDKPTTELGTVSISDEALPLYEVDGQHRVRGLVAIYEELKENGLHPYD